MKSNFKNPQAKKTKLIILYENYFILNYYERNIIVQLFVYGINFVRVAVTTLPVSDNKPSFIWVSFLFWVGSRESPRTLAIVVAVIHASFSFKLI